MNFRGPMGYFGDSPAAAGIPAQAIPTPGTLPQSPYDDFFDPQRDGSDVMYYTTDFGATLNNGLSTSTTIQIDSGVDFYWVAATFFATIGSTLAGLQESTAVQPCLTVLINDTGSRKNLQNSAFPVNAIGGPGERPYRLIAPRLFRASSTINFTWTNFSSSENYSHIYYTLHGYTKPRGVGLTA